MASCLIESWDISVQCTSHEYSAFMNPFPTHLALESILKEPVHEFTSPDIEIDEAFSRSTFQWIPRHENETAAVQENPGSLQNDVSSNLSHTEGWTIVERVLAFLEEMKRFYHDLDEDLRGLWRSETSFNQVFALMERLAWTQCNFKASGKSALIDVGYHYTTEENIPNIQENGLLSREERQALGIFSKFNGAVHGEGIYLGNNPFAFCSDNYGRIGILVARVRGTEVTSWRQRNWDQNVDTKISGAGFQEMVILRSSAQCVPLACFSSTILETEDDDAPGNLRVFNLHECFQRLLDKYFNGCPTLVRRALPSESTKLQRKRRRAQRLLSRKMPRGNDDSATSVPVQTLPSRTPAALTPQYNQVSPRVACVPTGSLYNEIINGGILDADVVDTLLKLNNLDS